MGHETEGGNAWAPVRGRVRRKQRYRKCLMVIVRAGPYFVRSTVNAPPPYRFTEREIMSTAPQIAFDPNDQFVSCGVSAKYFQLFAALTSQATRKVEFRALIEGFVDSIGRALHCDCAYIALLDPED